MFNYKSAVIAIVLTVLWSACAICAPYCQGPNRATACLDSIPGNDGHGNFVLKDICDLQGIAANSSAHYIVTVDIDASCTSLWNGGNGFTPIAGSFGGALEGNGHRVNGLYIRSSAQNVGLFEQISGNGSVDNLALTNVVVDGTTDQQQIGALTGSNSGTISFAYITGCVGGTMQCVGTSGPTVTGIELGGLVGVNGGTITHSYSGVSIRGSSGDNCCALYTFGGLVGLNRGTISTSFASGDVRGDVGDGGVLAGYNSGSIDQSYSSGSIVSGGGPTGGLIGWNQGGHVSQSYSSASSYGNAAGGLIELVDVGGTITQSYAVGRTTAITEGGGVADRNGFGGATVTNSYWDTQTTHQPISAGGTPLHTRALRAATPAGFDTAAWDGSDFSLPFLTESNCAFNTAATPQYCTPTVATERPESCPHLNIQTPVRFYECYPTGLMMTFEPPLAQFIAPSGVFTILPVGRLQLFQFSAARPSVDAQQASAAAAYTMIARLVGSIHTDAVVYDHAASPVLCGASEFAMKAHEDCLLNASGMAFWPASAPRRSVGSYVTFTPALTDPDIVLHLPRDDGDLEKVVESGTPILLHGATENGSGTIEDRYMIVTGFVRALPGDASAPAGHIIRLVANDPELGQQVFIDMNRDDGPAYHRAVLNAHGAGDSLSYKALTHLIFHADSYRSVAIQ
jgi:hypothetical protein